jgi:membrane-bound lytic murein transglycosylase
MIKRTLTLSAMLLALAAPAAMADDSTPVSPAKPAAHNGQNLQQRAEKIRRAYLKHCGPNAKQTDAERCSKAKQRIVERLTKLKARIEARVAKIQEKCASSTDGRCARAAQAVARLQKLEARIDKVLEKLQASPGTAPTASDQQTTDDLNAALDELATQLP